MFGIFFDAENYVYMLSVLISESINPFYGTWYTNVFDGPFFNVEVKNSKFEMADSLWASSIVNSKTIQNL